MEKGVNWPQERRNVFTQMGFQLLYRRLCVASECGLKNQPLVFEGFCPAIVVQHQLVANVFFIHIMETFFTLTERGFRASNQPMRSQLG